MKQLLLLSLALLLSMASASAQSSGPKRPRHSLEFSSGYPSLLTGMSLDNLSKNAYGIYNFQQGQQIADNFHKQSFNLAFRWESLDSKSDVVVVANVSTVTNRVLRYRSWNVDGHYPEGGFWTGGPDPSGSQAHIGDASISVVWRRKWRLEMERCHFYTALGVGIDLRYPPVPIPYIAPVGFQLGEKSRVYGFIELNVSGCATGGLAGLGIRLN